MDVLVETHDKRELLQALEMGADFIGINNRDLKQMKVDNRHIISILQDVPGEMLQGRVVVCESGVDDISYIERLFGMGINTFLIGTHFMASSSLEEGLTDFGDRLRERGLV